MPARDMRLANDHENAYIHTSAGSSNSHFFHHDAHWHVSWHLLRVNRLRLITLVPE